MNARSSDLTGTLDWCRSQSRARPQRRTRWSFSCIWCNIRCQRTFRSKWMFCSLRNGMYSLDNRSSFVALMIRRSDFILRHSGKDVVGLMKHQHAFLLSASRDLMKVIERMRRAPQSSVTQAHVNSARNTPISGKPYSASSSQAIKLLFYICNYVKSSSGKPAFKLDALLSLERYVISFLRIGSLY